MPVQSGRRLLLRLWGEEKRMMETLDLIGKVLCIFLLVVVIIVLVVMAVWMLRDMGNKE